MRALLRFLGTLSGEDRNTSPRRKATPPAKRFYGLRSYDAHCWCHGSSFCTVERKLAGSTYILGRAPTQTEHRSLHRVRLLLINRKRDIELGPSGKASCEIRAFSRSLEAAPRAPGETEGSSVPDHHLCLVQESPLPQRCLAIPSS